MEGMERMESNVRSFRSESSLHAAHFSKTNGLLGICNSVKNNSVKNMRCSINLYIIQYIRPSLLEIT